MLGFLNANENCYRLRRGGDVKLLGENENRYQYQLKMRIVYRKEGKNILVLWELVR